MLCTLNLQQLLQVSWFLVSKIEKTVSRVMCMETEFCTAWVLPTFSTHLKRPVASDAKFKFALKNKVSFFKSNIIYRILWGNGQEFGEPRN